MFWLRKSNTFSGTVDGISSNCASNVLSSQQSDCHSSYSQWRVSCLILHLLIGWLVVDLKVSCLQVALCDSLSRERSLSLIRHVLRNVLTLWTTASHLAKRKQGNLLAPEFVRLNNPFIPGHFLEGT